jgi:phage shock protein C
VKLNRPFHTDRANGKLLGVCAGIADYTGWDVTLVRVGMVLLTLALFPWTLVAYGIVPLIAKPRHRSEAGRRTGGSRAALRATMNDIDRRMIEVETYVTSPNGRLAEEIERLL